MNLYFIFFRQRICHCNVKISRKALLAIRAMMREFHRQFLFYHLKIPQQRIISMKSTVQIISIFIVIQYVLFSVNRHFCPMNPVAVTSNGCSQISPVKRIIRHIIVSQNYIVNSAVPVCHSHSHQSCAIVCYFDSHSIFIYQRYQGYFLPVCCLSKTADFASHIKHLPYTVKEYPHGILSFIKIPKMPFPVF